MSIRHYISPEVGNERKVQNKNFFDQETAEEVAEIISIVPNRPMGKVSEYVTGKMRMESQDAPIDEKALSEVESYLDEQWALCQTNGEEYIAGISDTRIALMDLLYLKAFYQVRLQKRNASLDGLILALAKHEKRIPQLTYEDLVMTNPLEKDPRIFFKGKFGRSELDFYKGHNVIEQHFAPAIEAVREIVDMCDTGNIDSAQLEAKIQIFDAEWESAMNYLKQFHQINAGNFDIFRQFFKTDETIDPERWLRGASGAFSPAVPILDMLIGLNSLDTANKEYLNNHIHLYPRDSQPEIMAARERFYDGKSLVGYGITYNNTALMDLYEKIATSILRFRSVHKTLIKKKAPKVYEGEVDGSAGFNIKEFILKNIEATKDKLKEHAQRKTLD